MNHSNMKRGRHPLTVALLAGLASLSALQAAHAGPPPQLTVSSSWEVFHDSDQSLCGTTKVHIDSPMRAFRDQNGLVHMTTGDPSARAWQWKGSVAQFVANPQNATLDCTPVMNGNSDNDVITKFDQKNFLQGLYFDPATAYVYAYSHEDYFGTRAYADVPVTELDPNRSCHDRRVDDGLPMCWYAAVSIWKADALNTSPAGHLNFVKHLAQGASVPWHIAIYPHVQYPGDAGTPPDALASDPEEVKQTKGGWVGYGTPSNLVRGHNADGSLDGYTYMFAYTSNTRYVDPAQGKGVCLFRSGDPSVRGSWRAWNGNTGTPGFAQSMNNPYLSATAPCALVNPGEFNSYLRSVHWHAPSKHYIAILTAKAPLFEGDDRISVRYATSTNLVSWNPSVELMVSTSSGVVYPAILDFDSASTPGVSAGDYNFDTIYDQGKTYLYYRTSVASGHTQIKRRLLQVSNY